MYPHPSEGLPPFKSGIRRPRAITSCHACRARRQKCDRIHPVCGRCSKNGDPCVWAGNASKSPAAPRRTLGQPSPRSRLSIESGQPRDGILMDTKSDSGTSVSNQPIAGPGGSAQGDDSKSPTPGYLTLQNGGRSRYVPNAFWANIENEVRRSLPRFPLVLSLFVGHGA